MSTRVAKIWCDQTRVILKQMKAEKPAEQLDARAAKVFKELNALRESVASNKGLVTDDELSEHELTFESIAVAIRSAAVSGDLIEVDRQSLRLSQLKKELALLLATGKSEKREAERKLDERLLTNESVEKALEFGLKNVRDNPSMTTIPNDATVQDFQDAGVHIAREKVLEALKTAETRTQRDVDLARSLLPAVQEAITKAEETAKVRNDWIMTRGPLDATVQDFQDAGVHIAREKVIEALKTAETRTLSDVELARSLLPAVQEAITQAEKKASVAMTDWKDSLESFATNLKIANFYVQQAEVFKNWAADNDDRKLKVSETALKGKSSYLKEAAQPATFEWLREGTEKFYVDVEVAKQSWEQGQRYGANKQARVAKTAFVNLKNDVVLFQKIIVSGEIEELTNRNPEGPESKLSEVFDSKGFDGFKSSELITRCANVMGLKERLKDEGRALPELTLGELAAIYSYTTEDYFMMNNCLLNNLDTLRKPEVYETLDAETKGQLGLIEEKQRDLKFDEKLKALTQITADALAKLPSFEPRHEQSVLGRGERDWKGAKEQYDKQSFAIQSFWSTGVGFKFPGKYQIEITPKPDGQSRGKVVGELSKNPHEMEVLFPPNTKFKVISVQDGKDEIKVKLEEI